MLAKMIRGSPRNHRQGPRRASALLAPFLFALSSCGIAHGVDAGPDGRPGDAGDASIVDDAALDGDLGDASGTDGGLDISAEFLAFCTRRGELGCLGSTSCCTVAGRMGCSPDRVQDRCERFGTDPALRDGTLVWRAERADAYLRGLEEAVSSCDARDRAWPRGYDEAFQGTLAEGEDCTPILPELGSLGIYRCEADLRCALEGSGTDYSGTCAPLGGVGDSCDHDCADGLYCLGDTTTTTPSWGQCEIQDDTARCLVDYACSSIFCEGRTCREPDPADTWCAVLG